MVVIIICHLDDDDLDRSTACLQCKPGGGPPGQIIGPVGQVEDGKGSAGDGKATGETGR